MATMSSPAQRRLDHWHSLETAAQRLADAVEAGADTDQPAADFAGLIDELERYERFWLFPGLATLRRLREYLINWDAVPKSFAVSVFRPLTPSCLSHQFRHCRRLHRPTGTSRMSSPESLQR
jgi:arginine decarboxylase